MSKTSILPKDTTQETVFDVTHIIIVAHPGLTDLSGDVSLDFFLNFLLPLKISVVQSNRPCDLKNSEHALNPA